MKSQHNQRKMAPDRSRVDALKSFFQQLSLPNLDELLISLIESAGKKSFLVRKSNKYVNVRTEQIAFFNIRFDSSIITCFDGQEYSLKYSLEQIQGLLSAKQFFRLNRQCLINFNAVLEVEHYYARKLLVIPVIPLAARIKVSKEKVNDFLRWLDNR